MFNPIKSAVGQEGRFEGAALQIQVAVRPAGDWVELIDRFGGNLFHTPQWAESRRSRTSRPLFFQLLGRRGDCCGIALGVEMWSAVPAIGKMSRQLEFETYPVTLNDSNHLLHAMMRHIISHAKKQGFRKVRFNSHLSRTILQRPGHLGLETRGRLEFIIDLTRSDSRLGAAFSKHHQRKLKKAQKYDLAFHAAQDLAAMRKFRQLQKSSRDRRLARGEHMAILKDRFFEELGTRYFAADLGTVFMLTHGGRPVSAAFVAHYGRQAMYMYGGSSDAGFKMDAPVLLFTHIFSRCRARGCTIFNLGGVSEEAGRPESQSHGLFRFKAGFGGTQRSCQNAIADHLNPSREKLLKMAKRLLGDRDAN